MNEDDGFLMKDDGFLLLVYNYTGAVEEFSNHSTHDNPEHIATLKKDVDEARKAIYDHVIKDFGNFKIF